jgi:hypothetical protein
MTLKPSIKEALKEAPAKNSAKKLKGACLCVTKKRAEDRGKVLQYIPRAYKTHHYGTHNSQVLDSVDLSSFLISGIRVDRPPHRII